MRREPDVRTFLAHVPLFQGASPAERGRLAAGTTRRRLARGEMLFRQGELPSGFHVLVHGRIGLTAGSPGRPERLIDILEPGRSFGEAIMFLGKPYIVSAKALSDALVLHVAKDTVFAELERNPAFARRMIGALSAKLETTVKELESYALGSGARRFAAWLLREVPPAAQGTATVTLPAAKRAIASRLNLSAEHLSRILRDLAAEGLIETRGRRLTIPDPARLRAWSRSAPSADLRRP
jgi:CRP/FNR family transcriptional regulator, dissimilatory nitrate respiration regulator